MGVEPADRLAVEQRGGRKRAIAQAIDGLDDERRARVGVVDLDAVRVAEVRDQVLAAERLTGFRAAELERRPVDRRASEIVVEAHHAQDFGLGEIERLRDRGYRGVVDIAEALLQGVQDRQNGAGLSALRRDHGARLGLVPRRPALHLGAS